MDDSTESQSAPASIPAAVTPPSTTLVQALERCSLNLPAEQIAMLDRYCQLLWQWNARLNLTRHTDYDRFAARDVVDSWQLAQLLSRKEKVLDVGTGGGVPGVIVAILRPDVQVTLCESVGKKAKAVGEMVRELGLSIPVHALRAEQVLEKSRFDTIMVRAVGPLNKMLGWFAPHWNSIGQLLAIKGPSWPSERAEARHVGLLRGFELRVAAKYLMPGTKSDSVILRIRRSTP